MLQVQTMDNMKTRYQQNYSLQNEIHTKNNRLYQMGSKKKWGHLR